MIAAVVLQRFHSRLGGLSLDRRPLACGLGAVAATVGAVLAVRAIMPAVGAAIVGGALFVTVWSGLLALTRDRARADEEEQDPSTAK